MIHQAGGTTFLSCQTLVRKQILSRCPHFVWKQWDRLQSYARIVYSKHPWQLSEHKLDPDSQNENLFWWPSEGTKCILKFYQILLFEMKFSHFNIKYHQRFRLHRYAYISVMSTALGLTVSGKGIRCITSLKFFLYFALGYSSPLSYPLNLLPADNNDWQWPVQRPLTVRQRVSSDTPPGLYRDQGCDFPSAALNFSSCRSTNSSRSLTYLRNTICLRQCLQGQGVHRQAHRNGDPLDT